MNKLELITKSQIRSDLPEFRVGDTVRVDVKIKETDSKGVEKTRIQAYEGLVTAIKGGSISKSFTVRKKSGGVAVKRIFKVNSPLIDSITVVRKGMVRRAKLNFIDGMEKEYKVKERN